MTWQEDMLLEQYGITPADLVRGGLHCEPEAIQPDVILLPNWRAEIFAAHVDSLQALVPDTVYELCIGDKRITLIRQAFLKVHKSKIAPYQEKRKTFCELEHGWKSPGDSVG